MRTRNRRREKTDIDCIKVVRRGKKKNYKINKKETGRREGKKKNRGK